MAAEVAIRNCTCLSGHYGLHVIQSSKTKRNCNMWRSVFPWNQLRHA